MKADKDFADLKLTPLDVVLRDLENDSERLALEQFARKHGITSDDAVWSIMALQYAVVRLHLQLGKAVHASNQKAISDFNEGVDFVIKRGMESVTAHANNETELLKVESGKQVAFIQKEANQIMTALLAEFRTIGFAAGKEGIREGASEACVELFGLVNEAKSAVKNLQSATDAARHALVHDLWSKAGFAILGGLIGGLGILAMSRFAFQ